MPLDFQKRMHGKSVSAGRQSRLAERCSVSKGVCVAVSEVKIELDRVGLFG